MWLNFIGHLLGFSCNCYCKVCRCMNTQEPTDLIKSNLRSSVPGFSSQLMLHPAAQATLSSILLSGVQGYTHSTPSPPPGLAPIDKQPNGVPDCSKGSCTLNGHVKVGTCCNYLKKSKTSLKYNNMNLGLKKFCSSHKALWDKLWFVNMGYTNKIWLIDWLKKSKICKNIGRSVF